MGAIDGVVLAPIKSENTTLASARIARFIASIFKIPLMDLESGPSKGSSFEYVFLVNANFGFSKESTFMPKAIQYLKKAKYPIYVNNDYVLTPPGQIMKEFRPRKFFWWTTVPETRGINIAKTIYVNWNQLTYEQKQPRAFVKDRLVYWGAFRNKRSEYFSKYLDSHRMTISTTARAALRFSEACPSAIIHPAKENLLAYISKYRATVYLEDNSYKHKRYCSPANRFYEAVSVGLPIFFQPESSASFLHAGYDIKPFIVRSAKELAFRLKESEAIQHTQNRWRKDYRSILLNQIHTALKETRNGV